jgi:hypothetical protein
MARTLACKCSRPAPILHYPTPSPEPLPSARCIARRVSAPALACRVSGNPPSCSTHTTVASTPSQRLHCIPLPFISSTPSAPDRASPCIECTNNVAHLPAAHNPCTRYLNLKFARTLASGRADERGAALTGRVYGVPTQDYKLNHSM